MVTRDELCVVPGMGQDMIEVRSLSSVRNLLSAEIHEFGPTDPIWRCVSGEGR